MTQITSIFQLESENIPGCVALRIARVKDVFYFPRNIRGTVLGNIDFLPDKNWIYWKPIDGTFLFDCNYQDSPEGVNRRHNIQFTLPGKGIDEYMLHKMQYDKLIALVTDRNNNHHIFGSPEVPLTFRYNRGSGRTISGRNEYGCSFLGIQFRGRAIYTGTIPPIVYSYAIVDHLGNELIDNDENILVYN